MRRREFIALISGAAAWPRVGHAQQQVVIGFLSSRSPTESALPLVAFRGGLKEGGFIENQNVVIEYQWADGHYGRLSSLAAGLVDRRVAVIVTGGGNPAALAAKAATATIPIVFVIASDPVAEGLVASLNSPGGNVTGASLMAYMLDAKRVELVHELLPQATNIGMLLNPDHVIVNQQALDVETAARALRRTVSFVYARTEAEFEHAFSELVRQRADALLVSADAFFLSRRDRLVELASRYRLPSVYPWRQFAEAGGLLSYGASDLEGYRKAGIYAARILAGAKPSELPVQQPTKFELVINLQAARAFGLTIPPSLLARADEVIE